MDPSCAEPGYTVQSYLQLVASGDLSPDDRVELLDGVIVAEPPEDPEHASGTARLNQVLQRIVGSRAVVRVQNPLLLGSRSAPEPDVALVAGRAEDYDHVHPTTALLVVEVASTSLPQDRLSKARIYAAAGIPEYWIVNLRDDCVEVLRSPDGESPRYRERRIARRGESLQILAFPEATVAVNEILPAP